MNYVKGLNHDFLLLDREVDGEWELSRFHRDPRALQLHDDFVRYLGDALDWVPAFNPSRREPCRDDEVTVTQLEGGYERLEIRRDEVVGILRQLAEHPGKVREAGGRLYLLHQGV